jgi:hypothetical protein
MCKLTQINNNNNNNNNNKIYAGNMRDHFIFIRTCTST